MNDIAPCLKDLVQRLVREELELRLSPRPTNNQIGMSRSKSLQLVFKNELPAKFFTKSKIKAKDNTPLEVILFDIESKSIVTVGSLSSIKIKICVLDSEFGSNGCEDWSADEFNAKILPQRDNKGQLLKGSDTVITLEKGVGYITNLEFTDNSRWTRTGRFRLGAKVQSNLKDAINIREATSKPFTVRDARGNQKHDTPSLNDEIWRLIHIAKSNKRGIYRRLSSDHGINTVGDLLKEHETNPSSLQEKFGKISKRKREEIIKHAKKAKHAKTCVAEATFDGQNYHSEKNTLISDDREAYKNLKDPVPIETITHHELVKNLTPVTQYSAPNQDLQQLDFPIAEQGQLVIRPSTLTPIIDEFANNDLIDSDQVRGKAPLNLWAGAQVFPVEAYMSSNIDDGTGWIDQLGSAKQLWEQLDPYPFPCGDGASCSINHPFFPNTAEEYIPSIGKSKTVWHKIRNALKWVRKAKLFRRQY